MPVVVLHIVKCKTGLTVLKLTRCEAVVLSLFFVVSKEYKCSEVRVILFCHFLCTLTGVVGWNFPRLDPAVQRIYLVLSEFEEAFESVQKAGKQLLPKQTPFFRELTEAKLYQRELLIRVK